MVQKIIITLALVGIMAHHAYPMKTSDTEKAMPIPRQAENGKWGYINATGSFIIDPRFELAMAFSEKLALVKIYRKFGYIDIRGRAIIKPQFDDANNFAEGLAAVMIDDLRGNKKWGYIDRTGNFVIPPRFSLASDFINGIAIVREGDTEYAIDRHGRPLAIP